jgi:hypothetical protein
MEILMKERRKKSGADEPPKRGGTRSVGDMLSTIGEPAFRRFGFVQSSIVSRWSEIVGARYAEVTAPESIRFPAGKRQEGVLALTVDGAHAPMLQHVAPAIIERVNRFFGYAAVARLAIRQGRVTPPEPKRTPPPSLRPLPVAMGDSLRAVGDPELRACLEALAGAVAASTGAPVFEDADRCE